ncbi:HTH-type transcriptional activator AllS [Delftia tsuruhatensis]|uniref:LysR family transcriptional regulator n=1 Tax=Delftia tsuruhatensis TaxID=180282 RepID=UPI001E6B8437|nr:LysR family transcriptional regulator [Delftia tsuruhatensis]CAB5672061.1 HTH-type transcriptional activator AllS [Delftia tsuruhatensis]CAC9683351.1 HTH-type transcriptional activator AllS [Delftia tsuruhatensis]
MPSPRDVLTPDSLAMLQAIAEAGSFAAAARQLGLVPSALTYRVRQIEDALDVLLFDRRSRHAQPTEAGQELLREGARLLQEIDTVAHRVRRVATGWEPHLTIVVDGAVARTPMLELVEAFYAMQPPTRLKLRDGILTGTLETLTSGRADLAIGVAVNSSNVAGLQAGELGELDFVFAVAPHHPLATAAEPITDATLLQHRIIAVADSGLRDSASMGLLSGQDIFTVDSMQAKIEAQVRGLGCGFLPHFMADVYVQAGLLVTRQVARPSRNVRLHYAWSGAPQQTPARALQWWLQQLESPATRRALMENHHRH